jgi:hypothetical protein
MVLGRSFGIVSWDLFVFVVCRLDLVLIVVLEGSQVAAADLGLGARSSGG